MEQPMPANTFLHGSIVFRDHLRDQVAAKRKHPDSLTAGWFQQLNDALNDIADELLLQRLREVQEANREMLQAACGLEEERFKAAVEAQGRALSRAFAYIQSPEDFNKKSGVGRPKDPTRTSQGKIIHEALRNAFAQIVLAETLPSLEAFLDLGRELNEARLYSFIDEALPSRELAQSYCRGLLSAVTRHHDARLDVEARERVNDRGHARGQLAHIEEGGHWLHVRDELCKFYNAALEELGRRLPPPGGKAKAKAIRRDKETEARDKWIYGQCCKGTPHEEIVAELRRRAANHGWRVVSSKQRIQQIGNEYADRHGIPKPPPRQGL
jgi:hypothetical protein